VRPEALDELAVAGALEVLAGQHHEQRRRVDASIVAAERDLVQRRHLALPGLVQDLPGLGVLLRRDGVGLRRGEEAKHPARERRMDREHLHRGDDAVAAERRAEPRDAGVRIGALRRVGHQHPQVGRRARDPRVERLVRRGDRGDPAAPFLELRDARLQRRQVRGDRHARAVGLARDREVQLVLVARLEHGDEPHRTFPALDRRAVERRARAALDPVEPDVGEQHLALAVPRRTQRSPPRPARAAHLEDVGEVRAQFEREHHRNGLLAVVREPKVLVHHRTGQEAGAEEVQRVAGHAAAPFVGEIGRGHVDDEQAVVGADPRVEHQRPASVEPEPEPRQVARAGVVEALLAGAVGPDVAEAVEHAERLFVLQHAVAAARGDGDAPRIERLG
jgi:hypothetical protein